MSNLEYSGYEELNKAIAAAKLEKVINNDLYNAICDEFEKRLEEFTRDTAKALVVEIKQQCRASFIKVVPPRRIARPRLIRSKRSQSAIPD